jgi:hypothetical protein
MRETHEHGPLVDFTGLPARLQAVGVGLAALALLGCVVDGVLNGLTFALMARWVGIFGGALLLATAVTTALHALGGAGRASARGERLASPDVGVAPRRLTGVGGLRDDDDGPDGGGPGDGPDGGGPGGGGPVGGVESRGDGA